MFKRATIIGDGAMGSVCGMLLCSNGVTTTLWGYDAAQLARFAAAGENTKFLPGYPLPAALRFEADDATSSSNSVLQT
ncbi:MAG TPA: hypothetical protein PLQ45_08135, partial [Anaerohalosphaeraceae bacterium]|nr:hypothetical protein [Anaerohalosphaeraceae bacterium]